MEDVWISGCIQFNGIQGSLGQSNGLFVAKGREGTRGCCSKQCYSRLGIGFSKSKRGFNSYWFSEESGFPSRPPLEILMIHARRLREEMAENNVGATAFADPDVLCDLKGKQTADDCSPNRWFFLSLVRLRSQVNFCSWSALTDWLYMWREDVALSVCVVCWSGHNVWSIQIQKS